MQLKLNQQAKVKMEEIKKLRTVQSVLVRGCDHCKFQFWEQTDFCQTKKSLKNRW